MRLHSAVAADRLMRPYTAILAEIDDDRLDESCGPHQGRANACRKDADGAA